LSSWAGFDFLVEAMGGLTDYSVRLY